MIKKLQLTFMAALLTGSFIYGQPQPEKKVLFVLPHDETLCYTEYYMLMRADHNGFAAMLEHSDGDGPYTLVFNGDNIFAGTSQAQVIYLDITEPDGYAIRYKTPEGKHLNLFGELIGPYEDIRKFDYEYTMFEGREHAYWYSYKDDGRWWVRTGKDSELAGPYDWADVFNMDSYDYGYVYREGDKWYEVFGEEVSGPYTGGTPRYSKGEMVGDRYIFYFREDDHYINCCGEIFGPFRHIYQLKLNEDTYAFIYGDGDKNFVNVNGTVYGPYGNRVDHVILGGEGRFIYHQSETLSRIFNVSGEIYGPYPRVNQSPYTFHMSENGNYIYAYGDGRGNHFLNVNGEVISVGDREVQEVAISDTGHYIWTWKNNLEEYYTAAGGKNYGPQSQPDSFRRTLYVNGDKYMFFYRYRKKYYVNANGREYGPYDNIWAGPDLLWLGDEGCFHFSFFDQDYNMLINRNGKVERDLKYIRYFYPFDGAPMGRRFHSYGDIITKMTPDGKHTIEATWSWPYVTIDEEEYGDCQPIMMDYDSLSHSFVWIGLERNREEDYEQLVKYVFPLED